MNTAANMLLLNKHFMANYGMTEVPAVPQEVTPITMTVLPMPGAALGELVITCGEYISVTISSSGQRWVRLPERRAEWRRRMMVEQLREAAQLYSLESFLRFIADCGFKVAP